MLQFVAEVQVFWHVADLMHHFGLFWRDVSVHAANTLQHTATHCNTLQHTATTTLDCFGVMCVFIVRVCEGERPCVCVRESARAIGERE